LTISPGVDEDAVVAAAGHLEPAEMVELLARAKAEDAAMTSNQHYI
jgi:predicted house-cleaning NTP pyrophosphatase (Maf/HAM1 superfamily)